MQERIITLQVRNIKVQERDIKVQVLKNISQE